MIGKLKHRFSAIWIFVVLVALCVGLPRAEGKRFVFGAPLRGNVFIQDNGLVNPQASTNPDFVLRNSNGQELLIRPTGGGLGVPSLEASFAQPVTLGQWSRASGFGISACTADGDTVLAFLFDGLIPNGLYTVWYSLLDRTQNNKLLTKNLFFDDVGAQPLGSIDGTQNFFRATPEGKGSLVVTIKGRCLLASTGTRANYTLAYHSDDLNNGPFATIISSDASGKLVATGVGANVHFQLGAAVDY